MTFVNIAKVLIGSDSVNTYLFVGGLADRVSAMSEQIAGGFAVAGFVE